MDVRSGDIKGISFVLIMLLTLAGCAYDPLIKKEQMYAPIEASLCNINQKVAGHFNEAGIPEGFNAIQYIAAIEQVCFSNPYCKTQAEGIFDSFGTKARKVNDMFTVMLCSKDLKWKVMEDFSCNNRRVEVQSWRLSDKVPCDFETDLQAIVKQYCKQ